jgi:hypothetical protein
MSSLFVAISKNSREKKEKWVRKRGGEGQKEKKKKLDVSIACQSSVDCSGCFFLPLSNERKKKRTTP